MSLNLQQFSSGITDYINRHNSNYSAIQALVNTIETDVLSLKASSNPGADQDYRLNAFNFAINGGFDYWQRGTNERPDAWKIENQDLNFAVEQSTTIKLNTYSAKTTNKGQLTQVLQQNIRKSINSTPFALGAYIKTDTANQSRIGIYNGITTNYSSYHPGSDEWEWIILNITNTSVPSDFKIVLDSQGGTVYYNSIVLIRGNPNVGPVFVQNDEVIEKLRVLSLYEKGITNIRGVGFLNASDRELESRIEFASPKEDLPLVVIDETDTGFDFLAYNVDRHGFNLLVAEIGGSSGSNGFEYNNINWTAEVIGR